MKVCRNIEDARAFKKALVKAYKSQDKDSQWRVDLSYKPKDYIGMKVYMGKDGVCAVHNGDIVSVCANTKTAKKGAGTRLIKRAVNAGGKKLDTYDGNFGFYQKMGFEPVSWTKVDKRYTPTGFKTSYKKSENVIFFRYNPDGKKYKTTQDFYNYMGASREYGKAQRSRDRLIESAKRSGVWNTKSSKKR